MKVTGWDNGLCQDYDKGLGRWFANRLGARQQLRQDFKMTQPLASSNSAKTLKELAVKGCGKCFYQDCDFPNCCKPKMLSDILKDTL